MRLRHSVISGWDRVVSGASGRASAGPPGRAERRPAGLDQCLYASRGGVDILSSGGSGMVPGGGEGCDTRRADPGQRDMKIKLWSRADADNDAESFSEVSES